jgi:hypothetical protein
MPTPTTGVLLGALLIGSPAVLAGQALAPPLRSWHAELRTEAAFRPRATDPVPWVKANSPSHSHTLTGLLIGGLVGVAATGVFLAAFCSDPDTQCGADEVGRALVIIAVPSAVVGAVIGSLIRTEN